MLRLITIKHRWIIILGPVMISILVTGLFPAYAGGQVDHVLWGELLEKYVTQNGVDYKGFQAEEDKLDRYLKQLEAVDYKMLERHERMAFFINVYNAWTIKLILSRWPNLKSIKDLGSIIKSPWKKEIVRLKTGVVNLDHIEHSILRPKFKDPRVHFAVNCASKGCPPLAAEPFTGAGLDEQLDRLTRAFINDPARTRLEGDTLYLSEIFKWFSKDFGDRAAFVLKYAQGDLKSRLLALKGGVKIKYLEYDWSLNGK